MKEPTQSIDESYLVTPRQRRQANTKRANAKIEEIRERLRTLALEKGAGKQLPTIRELCTLLNTSSATLTSALDLLETEQILSRKERQGIFVADSIHQGVIHVVFNVFGLTDIGRSPFWALLWAQIVQETEHRATFKNEKYRFHFLCIPGGQALPDDHVAFLNSPQTGGCLLIGVNARLQDHTRLLHVPHVTFAGGGDIIVQIDDQEKVRLAVQTLVQQGCKRIACWQPIWPYENSCPIEESEETIHFTQMLSGQRIPLYPELIRRASVPPSSDILALSVQDQGYLLAKEIFSASNTNRPDGIYLTDDMLTAGALVAMQELGIRVGEDVKIASHANAGSPILFGKTKQLAILEFDSGDMVRAMFSLLDAAMQHEYRPEDRIISIRPRLRI